VIFATKFVLPSADPHRLTVIPSRHFVIPSYRVAYITLEFDAMNASKDCVPRTVGIPVLASLAIFDTLERV